jgi:hypothetical protein
MVSFLNFAHIFAIVESSFQDYGLKKLTGLTMHQVVMSICRNMGYLAAL